MTQSFKIRGDAGSGRKNDRVMDFELRNNGEGVIVVRHIKYAEIPWKNLVSQVNDVIKTNNI